MAFRHRALVAVVGITGLVLGAGVLALTPDAARLPDGGRAALVLIVAVGWGFVGVGVYALSRRPDNPTGALLAAFGLCALASSLYISDSAALYLAADMADALTLVVFVHLVLAFPSGRLEDAASRITVRAGYAISATLPLLALLFGGDPDDWGCAGCPSNPLLIESRERLAEGLTVAFTLLRPALAAAAILLTIRRWRGASAFQRRALTPPLAVGAVILVLAMAWTAVQASDAGDGTKEVAQLVFILTFAALPVAFLAGLVRVRFFRAATVARLVDRLADGPGASGVDRALAAALGDPSAAVAYWLPGRGHYVDARGRELELPADGDARVATEIVHRKRRVGALLHAAVLREDPALVQTVTGAAALALENARLEAELRAQLEALRASRARIVEAGDAERRRLGRDLHDGAQQRLISILIGLQQARENPEMSAELVDRTLEEARAAVDELRELAAGIHPAVLSQRGLDAGLEALATRAAVPVELDTDLDERFPPAVESAAYFVVAETLTNVAKYAAAAHATVDARRVATDLVVEVRDDGPGGADASRGSGLRGLEDRVGALGGTLEVESPAGGGTAVRARIPLTPAGR